MTGGARIETQGSSVPFSVPREDAALFLSSAPHIPWRNLHVKEHSATLLGGSVIWKSMIFKDIFHFSHVLLVRLDHNGNLLYWERGILYVELGEIKYIKSMDLGEKQTIKKGPEVYVCVISRDDSGTQMEPRVSGTPLWGTLLMGFPHLLR